MIQLEIERVWEALEPSLALGVLEVWAQEWEERSEYTDQLKRLQKKKKNLGVLTGRRFTLWFRFCFT